MKQNEFWYENLTTLSEILSEGNYFTILDLSSGYHHIEIHPEYRKLFDFQWTFEMGLQNILNSVFYYLVCHQHITFLPRFYARLLSFGEVLALRLLFILMTVLQHLVVLVLTKQR